MTGKPVTWPAWPRQTIPLILTARTTRSTSSISRSASASPGGDERRRVWGARGSRPPMLASRLGSLTRRRRYRPDSASARGYSAGRIGLAGHGLGETRGRFAGAMVASRCRQCGAAASADRVAARTWTTVAGSTDAIPRAAMTASVTAAPAGCTRPCSSTTTPCSATPCSATSSAATSSATASTTPSTAAAMREHGAGGKNQDCNCCDHNANDHYPLTSFGRLRRTSSEARCRPSTRGRKGISR